MSVTHFSVVNEVFKAIDEEDPERLQKLIDCWDEDPDGYDDTVEIIARGLFYMLTRLKKLATRYGASDDIYQAWRDRITQTAVNEEIQEIFEED